MKEQIRPNPDELLRLIKEDEEKSKRGKLKIFFGMAAGVGKTYAMLESAQRLLHEGVDIVAGYIETHGRKETEGLVKDLEIIPRKKIDHRGIIIEELDLDAVLARRPAVILIDELAHTNAEGMRHVKRYQDVLELLDNGVNVYTTLNVQHIESLADVVNKITGVKIYETIPDSVLDLAHEIELIDISPEELLKRLAEGKVYVPEKARLAAERFFKKGNLTALREMALQHVARLVDHELRDYTKNKNITGPWKSGERLLVAVSPSPYSEYLIRWTRRMSFNLKVPWVALYIERQKKLTENAGHLLMKNLDLARELGAEVISTTDEDIVNGLIRVARQKNITQIIVGKPLRRYVSDFFSGGNVVERLLKSSGDIEIHIVSEPHIPKKAFIFFRNFAYTSRLNEYLVACASISCLTFVNFLLAPVTGYWTIALIYLFCVSLLSLVLGRGPVLLAASLSAIIWNFLFIPPIFTMRIDRLEDALMFVMYFLIAIIMGSLTSKLHSKEWALGIRERRITNLYEFSRDLNNALTLDDVITTAVHYIEKYFNSQVVIFLATTSGNLSPASHKNSTFEIPEKERGVVEWSFKNKKTAGLYTSTLPKSEGHYIPLIAPGSVVGVLGIHPEPGATFSLEQDNFLQNISFQLSMRIERENFSLDNQRTLLLAESEHLYKVLLNSISHELRTPLTTITGASSSLLDETIEARPGNTKGAFPGNKKASDRLNRLVDNLLDMSRLESGMLRLNCQMHDVGDVVSVMLRRLESELATHKVIIAVDDDLPMVLIDFTLMEQALTNMVFNAVIHTHPATEISINVSMRGNAIRISVSDNGPGLNDEEIPFLFDKFRRGSKALTGGTGLGLSICKGIVEAHGGSMTAGNNPNGGAEFVIELPQNINTDIMHEGGE